MIDEFYSKVEAVKFYEAAAHKRMEDLNRLSRDFLVAEVVESYFDQELVELSRHYTGTVEELAMEFSYFCAKLDECVEQLSRLRDVL